MINILQAIKEHPETILLCIAFILVITAILMDNQRAVATAAAEPVQAVYEPYTEPVTIETVRYYNIDLSPELQDCVFEQCDLYGINPELVLAIMYIESHYNINAKNGTCIGLMQIDSTYYGGYLLNPYTNIKTGVQILAGLYRDPTCQGKLDRVILSYNNGPDGLKDLDKQAIVSTPYLEKVLIAMENLKERRAI